MADKNYILNASTVAQKMQRLALEVAEQLQDRTNEIILIGIKNSGLVIAEQIAAQLHTNFGIKVTTISAKLDKHQPKEVELSEAIDFNNKHVIICDDVTNSGRTLLYALKPLLQYYPAAVQTLVLVERMHKQFPVKPDFVGLSIATTVQEHIEVAIENNTISGAYII